MGASHSLDRAEQRTQPVDVQIEESRDGVVGGSQACDCKRDDVGISEECEKEQVVAPELPNDVVRAVCQHTLAASGGSTQQLLQIAGVSKQWRAEARALDRHTVLHLCSESQVDFLTSSNASTLWWADTVSERGMNTENLRGHAICFTPNDAGAFKYYCEQ